MSLRTLALAVALSTWAYPAANAADGSAVPPLEASPMTATTMNCGSMMAPHDHGADKGTATPKMSTKCPMGSRADPAAAATPRVNAKAPGPKRGHDHARTHKLM